MALSKKQKEILRFLFGDDVAGRRTTPKPLTPKELLEMAVDEWGDRFETEEDINGADAVDWLAEFIEQAKATLKREED
jgi:hypothetical protein